MADRNRLDRECCHSHLVASLGDSWDRDPRALCWRLRSLGFLVSQAIRIFPRGAHARGKGGGEGKEKCVW